MPPLSEQQNQQPSGQQLQSLQLQAQNPGESKQGESEIFFNAFHKFISGLIQSQHAFPSWSLNLSLNRFHQSI